MCESESIQLPQTRAIFLIKARNSYIPHSCPHSLGFPSCFGSLRVVPIHASLSLPFFHSNSSCPLLVTSGSGCQPLGTIPEIPAALTSQEGAPRPSPVSSAPFSPCPKFSFSSLGELVPPPCHHRRATTTVTHSSSWPHKDQLPAFQSCWVFPPK